MRHHCSPNCQNHIVEFYHSEDYLHHTLCEFIRVGLEKNEGVFVIAKSQVLDPLKEKFSGSLDRVFLLDAQEQLARFMEDQTPNSQKFKSIIQSDIVSHKSRFSALRIYGEMVQVLADQDNLDGSLQLEECWNEVLREDSSLTLLCGYDASQSIVKNDLNLIKGSHSHEFTQSFSTMPGSQHAPLKAASDLNRVMWELERNREEKYVELASLKTSLIEIMKSHHIGEISSSLSHDIANSLSIINGNVMVLNEIMKEKEINRDFARNFINSIKGATQKIDGLLKNISLTLAHKGDEGSCDLIETMEGVLTLFRSTQKYKGMDVVFNKPSDHFMCEIKDGGFSHILLGILLFMKSRLEDHSGVDRPRIEICIGEDKGHLGRIRFSDNAKSLTPFELKNFFHPEKGNLSLNLSKEILKNYGAELLVKSSQDQRGIILEVEVPLSVDLIQELSI